MCGPISFLVHRKTAKVYAVPGIHSHSHIAEKCGVDEDECYHPEFHLRDRRIVWGPLGDDTPTWRAKDAAEEYVYEVAGTWRRLRKYAREGGLRDYLDWLEQTLNDRGCEPLWDALQQEGVRRDARRRAARRRFGNRIIKPKNQRLNRIRRGMHSHKADRLFNSDPVVQSARKLIARNKRDAERDHQKACLVAWDKLFSQKRYRAEAWKE